MCDPAKIEGVFVKYRSSKSAQIFSTLCAASLCSVAAAHAQSSARTMINVSAEVRPSCRIETSGSPTTPGWLSACGGRDHNRVRVSVDGRLLAPRANAVRQSLNRISLEPGSLVQIDF
jgi:hypothetical protein